MRELKNLPKNWSDCDKVSFLQRKVIINAIIYYMMDNNLMSDKAYDELSRQLDTMQKQYCDDYIDLSDTMYGYAFEDWTSATGFDLYYKLNKEDQDYLTKLARNCIGVSVGSHK